MQCGIEHEQNLQKVDGLVILEKKIAKIFQFMQFDDNNMSPVMEQVIGPGNT